MNATACLETHPAASTAGNNIIAMIPRRIEFRSPGHEPHSIDWWLDRTEEFAAEFLDIRDFPLREKFIIPTIFPWEDVLPVFDPSGIRTDEAVKVALEYQGLDVFGGVASRAHDGNFGPNMPTLQFIELSTMPNEDTMGRPGPELRASEEQFLSMRGYVFAYGLYWFAMGKHLDEESPDRYLDEDDTSTIFPDERLPGPGARREACAFTRKHELVFSWHYSHDVPPTCGARRVAQAVLRI